MTHPRLVRRALIALFIAVLSTLPASAADVLKQVPDTALAVVVVNNLTTMGDKIDEMAKKVGQNPPGGIEAALAIGGISEGVDRKGSAAVVIVAKEDDDEPGAILLIPVSDYKKFVAQLSPDDADDEIAKVTFANKEMAVSKAGDYAALVEAKDEDLLENVTSITSSLGDKSSDIAAWLKTQDAYALATASGIALASDKVLEALEGAKEQFEGLGDEKQAESIKMALGIYENLFKALRSDVSQAAFGIRTTDGAVHIGSRAILKANTKFGKLAATLPAPKESLLAGLPDGKYIFAGGGTFSAQLTSEFYKWSGEMMRAAPGGKDIEQADIDRMMKLSEQSLAGVKSMAIGMLSGTTDKPLYSNLIGVMKVDDSKTFMANYRKALASMNEIAKKKPDNPLFPSSTEKDVQIAGKPGLELTMKMSEAMFGDNPIAVEIGRRLLGDFEKFSVYLAAADDKNIAMGYIDRANVEKSVKSLAAGGKGAAAEMHKTAAMLPAGSQIVGFLNVHELLQTILANLPPELAGAAAPAAAFPESPSIGFGLKMSAEGVETDLVIPGETIEAIGETIRAVQAASTKR